MKVTQADPSRPLRAIVVVLALWATGRGSYLVLTNFGQPPGIVSAADRIGLRLTGVWPTMRPRRASTALPSTDRLPARRLFDRHVMTKRETTSGTALMRRLPAPRIVSPNVVADPFDLPVQARDFSEPRASIGDLGSVPTWPGPATSDWTGSIWLAARDGSTPGIASGESQLGGSQAGVRLFRHLTSTLSLTARASTALAARQSEASAGVVLGHGAVSLLAERRFALDRGGRNAWSFTAVAGVSDVALPHGLRLDGYGQAGVVGRDAFADGALRIERTVLRSRQARLSLGVGSWGSVQPGAARLDIGPQLVARVAPAGRPLRISAEWRQRVAGNAQPGSGPAVTLGADF